MKKYSDELIEKIRENIDIVDFIGEYVELNKRGSTYFGFCPFHDERTASFCVIPTKDIYYCFGCKRGGNVITFCIQYLKMSYDETIEYLSKRAGIDAQKIEVSSTVLYLRKAAKRKKRKQVAEKHKILKKSILNDFEKCKINKWIEEGIPQSIMDYYGVRLDRKANRIIYPVYDNNGNLINIKGRTLCDNYKEFNPPIPKYINYYPVGDMDYFQGFCFKKDILKKSKEIIIFESFKSVMKLDSFGMPNSVSSETSQVNIFQIKELIRMHCDVVIAFDNDISLKEIKKKKNIQILCMFTNVYVIYDNNKLLGEKSEKNSPVDKGEKIWKELYAKRIKI